MDTSDFDKDIQRFEAELEKLHEEMDNVRDRFLEATEPFAAAWIKEKVEQEVKRNSEITLSKSKNVISQMKSELDGLVSQVPQLVSTHVGDDRNWIHRNEENPHPYNSSYFTHDSTLPEKLDRPVRQVLGHAGNLLIQYDFAKDPSQDIRGGYQWKYDYLPGDGYKKFVYYGSYKLEVSQEMLDSVHQYYELEKQYAKAYLSLSEARRRKSETKAEDLWDNA
jgi:hypothetical protein